MKLHKDLKALLEDYEKQKHLMYNMSPNVDEDDLQFIHSYVKENRVVVKKKMLNNIIQEYKESCNCDSCTKKVRGEIR